MFNPKHLLQAYLCTVPSLYRQLLLHKNRPNFDKIVYLSLVKRGDTVFDVGANIGYYTWHFAHLVGDQGKVYAFEPVPETFAKISRTITDDFHLKNVQLIEKAVGEQSAVAEMHVPGNCQQASLGWLTAGSWVDSPVTSRQVSVISLDEYIEENRIAKLDFMKLDTEGYELMSMKGARRTLSSWKPLLCLQLCSIWFKDCGYSAADLAAFLETCGYTHFYLVRHSVFKLVDNRRQLGVESFGGTAKLVCGSNENHVDRLAAVDNLCGRTLHY